MHQGLLILFLLRRSEFVWAKLTRNEKVTMNNDFGRTWEEAVGAYFSALPLFFLENLRNLTARKASLKS
jgi:hypothetical protein